MKCLVKEMEGEALEAFLGQTITLFCGIYIYTGKVIGVNTTCIKLADAKIVYETGELNSGEWKDAQALPYTWYVMVQSIESFGVLK